MYIKIIQVRESLIEAEKLPNSVNVLVHTSEFLPSNFILALFPLGILDPISHHGTVLADIVLKFLSFSQSVFLKFIWVSDLLLWRLIFVGGKNKIFRILDF